MALCVQRLPDVELTGRRREDARPVPQAMYRVPAAKAWWPAGGAPLERIRRDIESLQQFMKDQSGRNHRIRPSKRLLKRAHVWTVRRAIATQGKRPDARVDKQSHWRLRSVLSS